jgi:hypothetical protein
MYIYYPQCLQIAELTMLMAAIGVFGAYMMHRGDNPSYWMRNLCLALTGVFFFTALRNGIIAFCPSLNQVDLATDILLAVCLLASFGCGALAIPALILGIIQQHREKKHSKVADTPGQSTASWPPTPLE